MATVHVKVEKGWYVYAESDTTLQLDKITIDGFKAQGKAVVINDKIFNKQLAVYDHDFDLTGTVTENKKLEIRGFASNGTEFLPVNGRSELYCPLSKINLKKFMEYFFVGNDRRTDRALHRPACSR